DASSDRISNDSSLVNENDSFLISEADSFLISKADSVQERAQEIKTHLAMKYKGRIPREIRIKVLRDIQSIDEPILSESSRSSTALKKRKLDYYLLFLNAYYDTIEAINKVKEARANKSLIRWIVSSGISFSAFDNSYFEDYIKILNPRYNSPKRYTLAASILDAEAANIILKIEKELS
ncbi:569_t:CDS:2, partial [Racocetra persica]